MADVAPHRFIRMGLRVFLACFATGCAAASPIYRDSQGFVPNSVTPRSTWQASGGVIRPVDAIDGDFRTAAVSYRHYTGQAITVDLSKICLFQTVIIEHGKRDLGFTRTVEVATSTDGQTFQTAYVAPGTRRVTILSLPKPALARFLRLRALRAGQHPWALAEIYVQ